MEIKCDHNVGFWESWEGGGIPTISECIDLEFYVGLIEQWFEYCPQCGADITKITKALREKAEAEDVPVPEG